MAKKLIFVDPSNVGRLHCDACGYDLPEPRSWDEFASGSLIGYECPACDADMLTFLDWHNAMKLFRFIELINKWFGWMGKERPTSKAIAVSAKMHNGRLEVKAGD